MSLHLIAVFKYGREMTGVRLLNTDAQEDSRVLDMQQANLIEAISSGKATVEGIQVQEGKLVATNGQFDRYPYKDVKTNKFGQLNHFVIIKQLDNGDYILQNYR